MKRLVMSALFGGAILALAVVARAAPSLPVTKPPVNNPGILSGPAGDPAAIQGQWFQDAAGLETVRPNEFYDNLLGSGGGTMVTTVLGKQQDWGTTNAIYGKAQNVVVNGQGNIASFGIKAVITNDTPGVGPWNSGANSHGESLNYPSQYAGPLFQARLVTEFAMVDPTLAPAPWVAPPYFDMVPHIYATNEELGAWYCWSPTSLQQPVGNYFVPAWELGDIAPGQSAIKDLTFAVDGAGLVPADPRFQAIMLSQGAAWGAGDLLAGRTTDLKLGNWLDTLLIDSGLAYPSEFENAGSTSVFHAVPEPGSLVLLCGLALFGLRRRCR